MNVMGSWIEKLRRIRYERLTQPSDRRKARALIDKYQDARDKQKAELPAQTDFNAAADPLEKYPKASVALDKWRAGLEERLSPTQRREYDDTILRSWFYEMLDEHDRERRGVEFKPIVVNTLSNLKEKVFPPRDLVPPGDPYMESERVALREKLDAYLSFIHWKDTGRIPEPPDMSQPSENPYREAGRGEAIDPRIAEAFERRVAQNERDHDLEGREKDRTIH